MSSKEDSHEEENKNIIRSYIDEIFNKHNLLSIERYFGGNYIQGSPQERRGWDQNISYEFFKAFPDWRASVEHVVAEDNLVMVFLNETGTHKGKFHGIPPKNKPVNIRSADLNGME